MLRRFNPRRFGGCFALLSLTLMFAGCGGKTEQAPQSAQQVMAGDILFQDMNSSQSRAIKLATGSEWTHCGIVLDSDSGLVVYEAVGPVRVKPLADWIAQGVDSVYEVRRIEGARGLLTPEALGAMKAAAEELLGRPYDWVFNWSDSALYCSELVWKVYERGAKFELTPLRQLGEYDLSSPEVEAILEKRYGREVPLEEPVVAPGDLATSELVARVNLED